MEYVVERILAEKRFRRKTRWITKYLVKWKGYNEETWEPIANLRNCPDKIEEFRSRQRTASSDGVVPDDAIGPTEEPQPTADLQHHESERTASIDEDVGDDDPPIDAVQVGLVVEGSAAIASAVNEKPAGGAEEKDEESDANVVDDVADASDQPQENGDAQMPLEMVASVEVDAVELPHDRLSSLRRRKKRLQLDEVDDIEKGLSEDRPLQPAAKRNRQSQSNTSDDFLDSDASDEDDGIEDAVDDAPLIVDVSDVEEVDEEEDAIVCDALAGPHEDLKSEFLRKLSQDGFVPAYYGTDTSKCAEGSSFAGSPRVSDVASDAARSMQPLDLFFFFLPKRMWRQIALETNRYETQTREARIAMARRKLEQKYTKAIAVERTKKMREKLHAFNPVEPHELLHLVGLLLARVLCPMRTGIEQHWATSQSGALPSGTWSRFMSRQRFREISRFLHFSDNRHPNARTDRAWKIRPVVDTVQSTFLRGMQLGQWVAFDEMVIPSRSSRNTVRVYLKNKPHKYGTKLFAVCCGETNYCARVEVYLGSRQDARFVDTLSGPAAVVRNLKAIWPRAPRDSSQKRVIVTDREYTCVSLAARLSAMGFCSIGTVTPSRLGFPKDLKYPFKTVPKRLAGQRGLCRLVRCTKIPDLYACSWIDNKPVYFLACGVSTRKTAVYRKERDGAVVEVECPEFIANYNKFMNGVDAHDQLRLQRYSIQRSVRVVKYYKTLFFGLLDMAIVNAYVVHKQHCKETGAKAFTHAQFKTILHEQLLNLTSDDFAQGCASPGSRISSPRQGPSTVTDHHLEIADDKSEAGRQRYRVCKVCSLLQDDTTKSVGKSRAYCVECSSEKARIYLCDRIRTTDTGNHMTCFQIWHQLLQNGRARQGIRKIRMRGASDRTPHVSFDSSASFDYS